MKKSEKIELRVNHAEKERLATIAERRGQTISDVVRAALAGELGAAPQSYPKWPGYIAILAFGLALMSLAWIASSSSERKNVGPIMSTTYLKTQASRHPILTTQVPHTDGFSQSYTIQSPDGPFQLNQKVNEVSPGVFQLKASFCSAVSETCSQSDELTLILSPPSSHPRNGNAVAFEGEDAEWGIETAATRIPEEESPDP